MVRCRSPRAAEPPLPGDAKSPAPLPVSPRQGPGGKQWGGGGIADDVGDEVTSTKGSRAKLSSFSCSHRFPSGGIEQASLGGTQGARLPPAHLSHAKQSTVWVTFAGEQTLALAV